MNIQDQDNKDNVAGNDNQQPGNTTPATDIPVVETATEETEVTYPTVPDAEGYFFPDEGLAALGIGKREDAETEDVTYRVQLSKGRTAIVRELTRKESNTASTIAGANAKGANVKSNDLQDRVMCATIALSSTFFDKEGKQLKYVMEDILQMKAKDSNRLNTACSLLNF